MTDLQGVILCILIITGFIVFIRHLSKDNTLGNVIQPIVPEHKYISYQVGYYIRVYEQRRSDLITFDHLNKTFEKSTIEEVYQDIDTHIRSLHHGVDGEDDIPLIMSVDVNDILYKHLIAVSEKLDPNPPHKPLNVYGYIGRKCVIIKKQICY
jgi:hypothetical protein